MSKKFRLRNMNVTRVDLVDRGANQDAHIVLAKAHKKDEEENEDRPFPPKDEEKPSNTAPPAEPSEDETAEDEAPELDADDDLEPDGPGAVKAKPDLAERIKEFLASNGGLEEGAGEGPADGAAPEDGMGDGMGEEGMGEDKGSPFGRPKGEQQRIARIRPDDFEVTAVSGNMMEWAIPEDKLPEGVEAASMMLVQDGQTVVFQWMIDPLAGPPVEGSASTAPEAFVAMRSALTQQNAYDPASMLGGFPGQKPAPGQPGMEAPGAPPQPGQPQQQSPGQQSPKLPVPGQKPGQEEKPQAVPAGQAAPTDDKKKMKVGKVLRLYSNVAKHKGPGPHPSGSPQEVHGSGGGGGTDSPASGFSREHPDNEKLPTETLATRQARNMAGKDEAPSEGPRSLSEIAREIRRDWGSKVNFGAKPYLDAMSSLDSIDDNYFMDSGSSVVAYFLSNATSWRGDTARRVKAELKEMLKLQKSETPTDRLDNTLDLIAKGLVEVNVFAETATGRDLRDILPDNLLEKLTDELSA